MHFSDKSDTFSTIIWAAISFFIQNKIFYEFGTFINDVISYTHEEDTIEITCATLHREHGEIKVREAMEHELEIIIKWKTVFGGEDSLLCKGEEEYCEIYTLDSFGTPFVNYSNTEEVSTVKIIIKVEV